MKIELQIIYRLPHNQTKATLYWAWSNLLWRTKAWHRY